MRGNRKTAAWAGTQGGGKSDDTQKDAFLSHKSRENATGFGHEIILWPDNAGEKWGIFVWRDSGGGYEAENLTFCRALVKALSMARHGLLRGAPIRFTADAAAILDRNIGRCGHAGN